ncbi:MAG TPA: flagellar hook capping protein [Gammaproteobacteria bacterium]|nr:flagellar hook capping protein [Gammaproteobacteria bacterium]
MIESIGTVINNPARDVQQAGLGQEDFLQILLTQLTFQDPLKPLDNQEFIAQFAQFAGLDQERQANENVEALLTMQAADQAVSLLAKAVEVRTDTGTILGEVTSIGFNQGVPAFTVRTPDGEFLTDIALSQIVLVQ